MGISRYRAVLRIAAVRRVILLGLVVRVPLWATNVILTLHVVTTLHHTYGAAGALAGVATAAAMISAPWRGRRLDRVGLRSTLLPSLVILTVCWSIGPFVSYWPLLALAFLADLFLIPVFSVVRQSLMAMVPAAEHKAALSIDSVATEISFMIGPALGVVLATYAPTSWALFVCEFASIAGGALLYLANPPLRGTDHQDGERVAVRSWMSPQVLAVLTMCTASTIVLNGTDVGVVAALRHLHHQSWIGWELAVWGLGSAVGGIIYGALHRAVPLPLLLLLLSGATLPVILAGNAVTIGVLLFIAGLPCAPAITASVEALTGAVPERVRGEVLGWHGAALTAGGVAGAPLAGFAIDQTGWHGGFVVPSAIGLAVAVLGAGVLRATGTGSRRGRVPTPEKVAV